MSMKHMPLSAAIAGLICAMMVLTVMPGAKAASIDVTMQTPTVYGAHAEFGFNLYYTPQSDLIEAGDSVNMSFAPGPHEMVLVVDILALVASAGYSIPGWISDSVNSTAQFLGIDDPWTLWIPFSATPLGTYVLAEIPVYEGLPLYVDITMNGQLNASISTSSGSLNTSKLTWTNWGGKEVRFTAPSSGGDVTVSTTFSYYVSNSYVLRIDVPDKQHAYTIEIMSFPLGEISFSQTARSHISVVTTGGSTAVTGGITGVAIGLSVGALAGGFVIGIVAGRYVLRKKAKT